MKNELQDEGEFTEARDDGNIKKRSRDEYRK